MKNPQKDEIEELMEIENNSYLDNTNSGETIRFEGNNNNSSSAVTKAPSRIEENNF